MSSLPLVLAVAVAMTAACTTPSPQLDEAQRLIAEGRVDEGLRLLEVAANTPPFKPEARALYVTRRDAVATMYVRDGDTHRHAGDFDAAEARYRDALRLDSGNVAARAGLDANARDRRLAAKAALAHAALVGGDLAGAERIAREVLAENSGQRGARAVMKAVTERSNDRRAEEPKLAAALARPISLEFRDAPLRTVFEMMSKTGGLNFIIDRDVKVDQRTTLFVRDTRLDEVLKVLLLTNQLDRKVLNGNSLIIFPNTPIKQREYVDTVTRTFYLANADVKQTATMLRAMAKAKDVYVDEKLNLLMMRDTPDAIRLAEQLIATQDLGEPEVVLELEVLEVASTLSQEIGTRFPDQIAASITGGTTDGSGLAQLGTGRLRAFTANPVMLLNLRKLDGTSNILANPRIRVKNREKAHVHIGEKVPVITTTSTANVGVSSSVNYLETGLKLDVEPNVFLEDEVAIKVQLEVSNIVSQLNISGTIAYRLGTRNAATSLRLKDGETQVLAGLISNEDRQSLNKLPLAGEFPVLGRLFQNDLRDRAKTEIVLLITPHIVRNIVRPETVPAQLASGTDAAPGAEPVRLAMNGALSLSLGDAAPAAASGAATPPGAMAAEGAALASSLPQQVGVGQEFGLSLAFRTSIGRPVETQVSVGFDPAVIAPVGDTGSEPGRVSAMVSSGGVAGEAPRPATLRFRVIGQQAGSTTITYDVTGSNLPVLAPAASTLSITARR